MYATYQRPQGFTLVELLAVVVLIGILSAIATARLSSPSIFELQASRDQLIAAFRSAQQLAMAQTDLVRFSTQSNQLTIYQDSDGSGGFATNEIINIDGVSFPLALDSGQTITGADFDFDRLGRTSEATLTISQGKLSVDVSISQMGFAE